MNRTVEIVLAMSVQGTLLALLACLLRWPLRNCAPRWCTLVWLPVLFRWLCPVSIPIRSGVPNPATYAIRAVQALDSSVSLPAASAPDAVSLESAPFALRYVLFLLWIAGMCAAAIVLAVQYARVRKLLKGAVRTADGIWVCDRIPVPFVVGILRSRIYLPATMSEADRDIVVLHEKTHVRRKDGVLRLAFCAVRIIHWFNPMAYIADSLCRKDEEFACDASALRGSTADERAEYASALLRFSGPRPTFFSAQPFDGGATSERIRNIMQIRKPKAMLAVLCAAACTLLCACAPLMPVSSVLAAETDNTEQESNAEQFARGLHQYTDEYEKFGVTFHDGNLWYNDQKIRSFVDGYITQGADSTLNVIARFAVTYPDGEVDVYTERDGEAPDASGETLLYGPITGMRAEPANEGSEAGSPNHDASGHPDPNAVLEESAAESWLIEDGSEPAEEHENAASETARTDSSEDATDTDAAYEQFAEDVLSDPELNPDAAQAAEGPGVAVAGSDQRTFEETLREFAPYGISWQSSDDAVTEIRLNGKPVCGVRDIWPNGDVYAWLSGDPGMPIAQIIRNADGTILRVESRTNQSAYEF